MEALSVILSFKDYENLKEFKKIVESDGLITTTMSYDGYAVNTYYTKDQAIQKLTAEIETLQLQIRMRKEKNNASSLDKLRKMSVWEFRKWRKGKSLDDIYDAMYK